MQTLTGVEYGHYQETSSRPKKVELPLQRHLGTFELEGENVEQMPEVVRNVMKGVIVLDARMNAATGVITYTAIHEDFEGVPEGENIPAYDVDYDEASETASWAPAAAA